MQIFKATCKSKQVLLDNTVVPNCPILGGGGDSSGWLVIADAEFVYLPNTTPDVSELISHTMNALQVIASGVLKSNAGGDITTANFSADLLKVRSDLEKLRGRLK